VDHFEEVATGESAHHKAISFPSLPVGDSHFAGAGSYREMDTTMISEMRNRIVRVFGKVFREHTGAEIIPVLTDDTVLLETGLDSLGFAVLVVMLEQELGYDPFVSSEDAYYPRTFGELVTFYQTHIPQ
jgi:acyl carrier protein